MRSARTPTTSTAACVRSAHAVPRHMQCPCSACACACTCSAHAVPRRRLGGATACRSLPQLAAACRSLPPWPPATARLGGLRCGRTVADSAAFRHAATLLTTRYLLRAGTAPMAWRRAASPSVCPPSASTVTTCSSKPNHHPHPHPPSSSPSPSPPPSPSPSPPPSPSPSP